MNWDYVIPSAIIQTVEIITITNPVISVLRNLSRSVGHNDGGITRGTTFHVASAWVQIPVLHPIPTSHWCVPWKAAVSCKAAAQEIGSLQLRQTTQSDTVLGAAGIWERTRANQICLVFLLFK